MSFIQMRTVPGLFVGRRTLICAEPPVAGAEDTGYRCGACESIVHPSVDPAELVLNAEVWEEPVPVEARDLPRPTVEYVASELAPRLAERGIEVRRVGRLARGEVDRLPSSWARRLSHGREHPNFLRVEAALHPVAG